jgi:hypothetical protein
MVKSISANSTRASVSSITNHRPSYADAPLFLFHLWNSGLKYKIDVEVDAAGRRRNSSTHGRSS